MAPWPPGISCHPVSDPPLCHYVNSVWLIDGLVQTHQRERVLPTGTMDIVLTLNRRGFNEALLAGVRTGHVEIDAGGEPRSMMAIHFKPGAGHAFVDVPLEELTDQTVSLDNLWGAATATFHEQLVEAGTPEEKLQLVTTHLRRKLNPRTEHPAVAYALREFMRPENPPSVAEIREATGLSHKRFIKLFRNQTGASPKFFQRICRFKLLIDALTRCREPDWADMAVACGYYDQAHFNHDFHHFSGINPRTYLRDRVTSSHVRVPD